MKRMYLAVLIATSIAVLKAQVDIPNAGGNPRATVKESVGITDITVEYSRPDVAGREGKVWGALVTYGFTTNSFITGRPTSPWRAGANENTTLSFEHDVKVEGKSVPAGTYGLHMAVWPDSVIVILSKDKDAWGSFYYQEKNDQLRVTVKPQMNDKSVEWLKYEFIDHKEKSATIAMMWEKLIVPIKIEVDVDNIVINRLRDQLTSNKGFNAVNLLQASQYCLNKNINLEEALTWANRAITGFGGQRSFVTLRNVATAYEKLNRLQAADSVMNEALPMGNAAQHVAYGRSLIAQKRVDKAVDIMNGAASKFGNSQATLTGLAYAFSAKSDYKKAIDYASQAMALAPNEAGKKALEALISKLKEGKDINL